jgi:hypothetical protein
VSQLDVKGWGREVARTVARRGEQRYDLWRGVRLLASYQLLASSPLVRLASWLSRVVAMALSRLAWLVRRQRGAGGALDVCVATTLTPTTTGAWASPFTASFTASASAATARDWDLDEHGRLDQSVRPERSERPTRSPRGNDRGEHLPTLRIL